MKDKSPLSSELFSWDNAPHDPFEESESIGGYGSSSLMSKGKPAEIKLTQNPDSLAKNGAPKLGTKISIKEPLEITAKVPSSATPDTTANQPDTSTESAPAFDYASLLKSSGNSDQDERPSDRYRQEASKLYDQSKEDEVRRNVNKNNALVDIAQAAGGTASRLADAYIGKESDTGFYDRQRARNNLPLEQIQSARKNQAEQLGTVKELQGISANDRAELASSPNSKLSEQARLVGFNQLKNLKGPDGKAIYTPDQAASLVMGKSANQINDIVKEARASGEKQIEFKLKLDESKEARLQRAEEAKARLEELIRNNASMAEIRKAQLELSKATLEATKENREQKRQDAEDAAKVDGWELKPGFRPNNSTIKAAQEVASSAIDYETPAKELLNLIKSDPNLINPQTAAKAKQLSREVQLAYKGKGFADLGVLNGKDLEVLEGIIPTIGSARNTAEALVGLKNNKQLIQDTLQRSLSNIDKKMQLRGYVRSGQRTSTNMDGGKIKVTNGKETLMVDPEDVSHAEVDGFQVVK